MGAKYNAVMRPSGFSVTETLIAFALLVLLGSLGVVGYSAMAKRSAVERTKLYLEELRGGLDRYLLLGRRYGLGPKETLDQALTPVSSPIPPVAVPGRLGSHASPLPWGFVGYYTCLGGARLGQLRGNRTGITPPTPPPSLRACYLFPYGVGGGGGWRQEALRLFLHLEAQGRTFTLDWEMP